MQSHINIAPHGSEYHIGTAEKGVANGLAGLDASSKFAGLLSSDSVMKYMTFPDPTSNSFTNEPYIDDGSSANAMTSGAAGAIVVYDLTAEKMALVGVVGTIAVTVGAIATTIYLECSYDNANWYIADSVTTQAAVSSSWFVLTLIGYFRYFRIRHVGNAPAQCSVSIPEAVLVY